MYGGGWWLIWGVPATFGLPLIVIGLILRLCESSWQKSAGELGSRRLMSIGGGLCLPLVVYLAVVVFHSLLN